MASQKRDLIALIDHDDVFVIINPENGEQERLFVEDVHDEPISNVEDLCDLLGRVLPMNRIKGMLFVIVSTDFDTFDEANHFRLGCREFCKENNIFFATVPFTTLEAIYATSETKTMVNEGEQVLIAFSVMPGHPTGITLIRENGRYRILKYNRSRYFMFTDEWKKEFFGIYDPKKVIVVHNIDKNRQEEIDMYEDYFKQFKAASLTQTRERELVSKGAVEKLLHLMGEKISEYDVSPPCLNEFFVEIGTKTVLEARIYADPLPCEKSIVVDVDASKRLYLFVRIDSLGDKELLEEKSLSAFKSRKIKITLNIDVNALYEFNVVPVDEEGLDKKIWEVKIDEEETVPKPVDVSKARIVFQKQNFAVFLIEGDDYRMIQSDGGLDGVPIYISFTQEKPIVGQAAKECYNTNPQSVVFDLIKLCSISSADVMNPKWGFSVSKENESLMVSVQTPEGEKKSSCEFLMSLVLRRALKIIKDETGKKMENLQVQFCTSSFSPNDVLKTTLVKAGKLMNVEIEFC